MLRWVVHLPSEMCHINQTQHTNDHLAEAPAEGNCRPPGAVICVDLRPQAHLASSAALMAVLLCRPPICSPQLKINSPLHCWSWRAWQCSLWICPQTRRSQNRGNMQKEYTGEGALQSRREKSGQMKFTGNLCRAKDFFKLVTAADETQNLPLCWFYQ